MTLNLGGYLGWSDDGQLEGMILDDETAAAVDFMIGFRGISITLYRPTLDDDLAPQRVLLVPAGQQTTVTERKGTQGDNDSKAAQEHLLIVGQSDLDIRRGDQFVYNSPNGRYNYQVARVERSLFGMIQAFVEFME